MKGIYNQFGYFDSGSVRHKMLQRDISEWHSLRSKHIGKENDRKPNPRRKRWYAAGKPVTMHRAFDK